jgi:hypothetical protein
MAAKGQFFGLNVFGFLALRLNIPQVRFEKYEAGATVGGFRLAPGKIQ